MRITLPPVPANATIMISFEQYQHLRQMQGENSNLRNMLELQTTQVAALTKENADLKKSNQDHASQIQNLQKELETAQTNLRRLRDSYEIDAGLRKIEAATAKKLEARVKELEATQDNLTIKTMIDDARIAEQRSHISALDGQIVTLDTIIEEFRQTATDAQANQAALQDENNALKRDIQALKRDIQALKRDIQALRNTQANQAALQHENNALKQELHELRKLLYRQAARDSADQSAVSLARIDRSESVVTPSSNTRSLFRQTTETNSSSPFASWIAECAEEASIEEVSVKSLPTPTA